MKLRPTRELSVPGGRKVLAQLLSTEQFPKSIGAPRLDHFKGDPFHPSLAVHEIRRLSAKAGHTIHSAVIDGGLRVLFRIDGSWVTTLDVGTHKLYRA